MRDCNCSLIRNSGEIAIAGDLNSGRLKLDCEKYSINSDCTMKRNTNGRQIERRMVARSKSRIVRQSEKNWVMSLWRLL